MGSDPRETKLIIRIRVLLIGFTIGLFLSGVTAFPLTYEVTLLAKILRENGGASETLTWIEQVRTGLVQNDAHFPFIAYGTDWLAFAHIVIATAFLGPLRDPVRHVWTIQWGVIACVGVIPLAFICGPIRGIPFVWTLLDCSFGVVGAVPLLLCLRMIRELESLRSRPGHATDQTA